MKHNTIYALLLAVLFQLLWVVAAGNGWSSPGDWERRAIKVSAGFPVQFVAYTVTRTTGNLPPSMNYPDRSDWQPGVHISWFGCVIDLLTTIVLFIGIRYILRYPMGSALGIGYVMGLLVGGMFGVADIPAWRTWSVWLVLPLLLLGLPIAACYASRKARSAVTLLVILTTALPVGAWIAARIAFFRPDHEFSLNAESFTRWDPSFHEIILIPFAGAMVLFLMSLAIRHLVPGLKPANTNAQ